ncbi:hypothetical protein PSCICO_07860 [Pseudomonas cichorii]|uniref:hypothetical protein n=1 Tax=Pseudomonas cichorii TaxID=36746 RepID=UPI00191122AA|nr:hypothetical protein [Pseudomonas cichorii]GFM85387.1 hypothetical protein PSCICO_07860 [Pseudomonas cichorii]
MARTKLDVTPKVELAPLDAEALTTSQNLMASMIGTHSNERDLVNQLLGQAQMADAIGKFTATVAVSKMAHVKEHKLYQALAGMLDRDGRGLKGTWEEFCSLLGSSAPKVNEDIHNLRSFGEAALESMSSMGIGYREMRQYRRLPEDSQAALIAVAETGDKEAFLDLAEEIIAKHAKDKETLTQRLDETNADYEAQSKVMATKTAELDKTRQELEKTRKRIQAQPASETITELRKEATAVAYEAEAIIRGSIREAFSKLAELQIESDDQRFLFEASLIRQLEITLGEVRSEFHLPTKLEGAPVWMDQA